VAAGLAAGPAVPYRRLGAAGHRRWAGHPGNPHARLGRGPDPGPGLGSRWDHLAAADLARVFLLPAPVTVPAGLALGGLIWAWRIYAVTAGIAGWTASAPVSFDAGTGAAAYYADILQAVLDLAVLAPRGPPANTASFLDRLEAKWLQHAWGDGRHPAELARPRAAARQAKFRCRT
jgi:hypothetical protein